MANTQLLLKEEYCPVCESLYETSVKDTNSYACPECRKKYKRMDKAEAMKRYRAKQKENTNDTAIVSANTSTIKTHYQRIIDTMCEEMNVHIFHKRYDDKFRIAIKQKQVINETKRYVTLTSFYVADFESVETLKTIIEKLEYSKSVIENLEAEKSRDNQNKPKQRRKSETRLIELTADEEAAEIWKTPPIEKLQDCLVSNYGRIKTHKGKIAKQHRYNFDRHNSGNWQVCLHGQQYFVKSLVAKTFLDKPKNKKESYIAFKNDNLNDCRADNLRYGLKIETMYDEQTANEILSEIEEYKRLKKRIRKMSPQKLVYYLASLNEREKTIYNNYNNTYADNDNEL